MLHSHYLTTPKDKQTTGVGVSSLDRGSLIPRGSHRVRVREWRGVYNAYAGRRCYSM